MTTPTNSQSDPQPGAVLSTPRLPARALIGWLPPAEGALWLAGRQAGQQADPALLARCEQARAAVDARPPGVDQSGLLADPPAALAEHIVALQQDPMSAPLFAEGFEARLVNLSQVCAAQPQIHVEDAIQRVAGLSADDIRGIAAVTLPLPTPVTLSSSFDSTKMTWIVSSPNPNLRIAAQFSAPVGPGLIGYGFAITVSKSYLQVAGLNGRYFLRDGYHRAYGLLAAGITHVPALVKEFGSIEEVGLPAGLLPQAAYLGSRPPRLEDYLDDNVSASTRLPITQKLVVVQALDLHTLA
jgi:hypothetical protein